MNMNLDIGKAGHHLKLGAAIPYNGREIEVRNIFVTIAIWL